MMGQQQQNVGGADLSSLGNNMGIMGSDSGVGDMRPQELQMASMKRNQMQQQQQMMLRQQQQQRRRQQQQQQRRQQQQPLSLPCHFVSEAGVTSCRRVCIDSC